MTLNSIAKGSTIRSIDKTTFDALSRQSREQTSRDASVADFGLDLDRDLLRAVTGVPEDRTLGNRMAGRDAVAVSVHVDLGGLHPLLERYLDKYEDQRYRADYPWIDQIAEVNDRELAQRLDGQLVEAMRSDDHDRLWLAVPDIVEWTDLRGVAYSKSQSAEIFPDVSVHSFKSALPASSAITVETLRSRQAHAIRASDDVPILSWPIYRCVYFEVVENDSTYLLTDGHWYCVDRNFVQEVNQAIAAIPRKDLAFPPYEDDSEQDYIGRVCAADRDRCAILDSDTIVFGGGRSRIESCDIYTRDKELIHIKRYAGSSVLSHLFAQGLVASELFYESAAFRSAVNERLPEALRISTPVDPPGRDEYEIVYAIVSKSSRQPDLPFFSKVNLKNATRNLRRMGYLVSISFIPVTDLWLRRERIRRQRDAARSRRHARHP